MQPYGMKKRRGGIHPHNECEVCSSEPPASPTTARTDGRKEIDSQLDELADFDENDTMHDKWDETDNG
jgi:hypothetical protein